MFTLVSVRNGKKRELIFPNLEAAAKEALINLDVNHAFPVHIYKTQNVKGIEQKDIVWKFTQIASMYNELLEFVNEDKAAFIAILDNY